MKLAFKLFSLNLLIIIILLSLDSYLMHEKITAIYKNNIINNAALIKNTIVPLLKQFWNTSGNVKYFDQQIKSPHPKGFNLGWVWTEKNGSIQTAIQPPKFIQNLKFIENSEIINDFDLSHELVTSYIQVKLDDSNHGTLQVRESLQPLRDFTKSSMIRTAVLTLLMICIGAIFTWIFGFRMVGIPIRQLKKKAEGIGRGTSDSTVITIAGNNELSELSTSLETLEKTIKAGRARIKKSHVDNLFIINQLRHTDRLKTVGSLASGVAHELGTPLNVISGRASLISSGELESGEIKESAEIIKNESDRMIAIIRGLLNFARRQPPKKESLDLDRVVNHTVSLLRPMILEKQGTLEIVPTKESIKVEGDENQIQQVITNILVNAIDAIPEKGKILLNYEITRTVNLNEPGSNKLNYLVLNIEDNGCGMSSDLRAKVFDPFFTTKDIGCGTGLGLSIVHGIVAEHGGWVNLSSKLGVGSKFSIFLPEER